MKKISKSPPPNALTNFALANPTASWEADFRNHNASQDYKAVRRLMIDDQGGICGYCECQIAGLSEHKQRVEHFHDKSDQNGVSEHNWGLDWQNVFAVCLGGSDADREIHPLPGNLSCDSHKNHLKSSFGEAPEGYVLNPLAIPASPCLFKFDKRTGELKPDVVNCAHVRVPDNRFGTVQELVENTIKVLNLNCPRLTAQRLEVLNAYNSAVKIVRSRNDQHGFSKLARQWFNRRWPAFFTTRRLLLGDHAETYLQTNDYNG